MGDEQSKRARESIDRLLAGRDRLTADEKRAIFASVAADPAVRPRRVSFGLWAGIGAAVAAASVVLMVALPRGDGELTPRGGAHPSFTLSCAPAPCAAGATLLFELEPAADQRYFAAFGRTTDGKVIWYFPENETGVGLRTDAMVDGIANRGVSIGQEHGTGRVAVTGVFSRAGMTRAEVRALIESAPRDPAVVERSFEVTEGGSR